MVVGRRVLRTQRLVIVSSISPPKTGVVLCLDRIEPFGEPFSPFLINERFTTMCILQTVSKMSIFNKRDTGRDSLSW